MSAPIYYRPSEVVTLRDRYQLLESELNAIMDKLKAVYESHFFAFDSLVKKCRDPSYQFQATPILNPTHELLQYKLIESDGSVSELVQRIVVNAVQGEFIEIKIIDPTLKV